jgi:hypothetical protein
VNVKLHALFASGMDGGEAASGFGMDVVTNRNKKSMPLEFTLWTSTDQN